MRRKTAPEVRNKTLKGRDQLGKLEVTVVSREKESPHFETAFATGSK